MKKLICFVLTFVLIFTLVGCHKSLPTDNNTKTDSKNNQDNNSLDAATKEKFPLFAGWSEQETIPANRNIYEKIILFFPNIDGEIKRGWLDEGSIKFLKLIKGNTISENASYQELSTIYEDLGSKIEFTDYSIRDFFCVDNNDIPTSTGIYNFLKAINQLESQKFNQEDVVFVNSDGNITGWNFDSVGGNEKIAEALGICSELVSIIVHAAIDAGFNVSFN